MQIKLKEDDGIGLASVDLSGLPSFHQSTTKRKIYLCYRTETLPKCAAAMDVLSISSPIFLHTSTSKLSHSSRSKPISHFPSSSSSKFPTIKSLSVQTPKPTFTSKSQALDGSLLISSAPQTPATAMRGTEGDALGLLLRERIVFLGSSIDDFVADAIISQLLLLDAQDSKKDIKLFINSTGGSLRFFMLFTHLGFFYFSWLLFESMKVFFFLMEPLSDIGYHFLLGCYLITFHSNHLCCGEDIDLVIIHDSLLV